MDLGAGEGLEVADETGERCGFGCRAEDAEETGFTWYVAALGGGLHGEAGGGVRRTLGNDGGSVHLSE